jgi:hypothetical protein
MGVIGGKKLRFRVNAERISAAEAPKNYGSVDDFIQMSRTGRRHAGYLTPTPRDDQFRTMKSVEGGPGRRHGHLDFLSLLSSHRFETMSGAT